MTAMNNGVAELAERFRDRGYVFRAYPAGIFEPLRYQCGVIEWEHRIVPPHLATGHREIEVQTEVFRLIAFAATADELAEKLSRLPMPPHRELLDA